MNNWMLTTARFTKQKDDGSFVRVSEKNLFAAVTFSQAEERVYKEIGEVIRGEFIVTAISKEDFHDIFMYDDSDFWWKCKISFEDRSEDMDKPKKVTQTFLVGANSAKEATERLIEKLDGMMISFEIISVVKSPIVEVYPHK